MSWAVQNAPTERIVHAAMHDLGSGSLLYARITNNFASASLEYFGVSGSPPAPNQPDSYTSIAVGDDGRVAVAYTAFESLPVPAYHLYIAKRSAAGGWTTQKILDIVSINRIELALSDGDVDEWRIAYSNPTGAELRIVSPQGNAKVCDLVYPASQVGFDLFYSYSQGTIAYHDPVNEELRFAYLSETASGTIVAGTAIVDSGPGVGIDVRFGRNNVLGQFGNHYLAYRDDFNNAIKLAKFEAGDVADTWRTETAVRGAAFALRRPAIALNVQGEPIVACFRESWNDVWFYQRLQGRWYGARHGAGSGAAYLPSLVLVPDSTGAFSVLVETIPQRALENVRGLTRIGPVTDFTDADGDGVPLSHELAFAMNPAVKDREHLPVMMMVNGELNYAVRKANGGTFADNSSQYFTNDWRIWIEISEDLENWSSAPGAVKRVSTAAVNSVRVSTYAPVDPQRKMFFRTRVERRE